MNLRTNIETRHSCSNLLVGTSSMFSTLHVEGQQLNAWKVFVTERIFWAIEIPTDFCRNILYNGEPF